jgi:uncharacterized protein (DUF305 family)
MRPFYARAVAAALLGTVATVACRSAAPAPAPSSAPPAAAGGGDAAAIAKARADSARYPYTAADVHFMSAMIAHHAQAIVMAGWAPSHGASPSVRTLAERIINAQRDEIATAQRWLRDRRQPVPDAGYAGMTMAMDSSMGAGHAHAGHDMGRDMMMPGMLSEAQLKELDAARGAEFDRLFLTFMIRHHRGAVTMVKELFATDGAAQDETVFKFASDVNVDQTTEIQRMQKMLAAVVFEKRAP